MEEVDIVIVGAEGVAESGGVINKVGKVIANMSLFCEYWWDFHSEFCITTIVLLFNYYSTTIS